MAKLVNLRAPIKAPGEEKNKKLYNSIVRQYIIQPTLHYISTLCHETELRE